MNITESGTGKQNIRTRTLVVDAEDNKLKKSGSVNELANDVA